MGDEAVSRRKQVPLLGRNVALRGFLGSPDRDSPEGGPAQRPSRRAYALRTGARRVHRGGTGDCPRRR